MTPAGDLADLCRALVCQLRNKTSAGPRHAGATLEDHLLTTAALVGCLAHGAAQRDLLRLAALTHDLPEAEQEVYLVAAPESRLWVALLQQHGAQLDQDARPDLPDDPMGRLLALAHLAASARLPVRARQEFATHPLAGAPQVELVYGGATKIKNYVFESARLPEIRGASALLDHINRLDLPALWGLPPERPVQQARYSEVRDWFEETFRAAPLDAPECVLYASGGNILALAPAGHGADLAQAIERRYTEVTQVANSVAVSEPFSLLELQYGRRPWECWIDTLDLLAAHGAARELIAQSYGVALRAPGVDGVEDDRVCTHALIFGADSLPESEAERLPPACRAGARKGFGELVTLLAAQADRRRSGDGVDTGARRFLPFIDLVSTTPKCASCDTRPAAETAGDRAFCTACAAKRDAGARAKKGSILPQNFGYPWIQPWGAWLESRSKAQGRTVRVKATTNDLQEIGEAAHGGAKGFVGLIYADGNNVGSHIAGLSSIGAYRRFAQQMLEANERAVAAALLDHFRLGNEDVWPFEIITIGGDDVLIFVPADRAFDIAAAIARHFTKYMQEQHITLSVGVLIMAQTTPVRFARDLVEELLKRAKELSKDSDGGPTIDFMALKAATMVSETIAEYRRAAFERVRRREHNGVQRTTRLLLTRRPYQLDDFHILIAAGRALTAVRFPKSQLHQLGGIVAEGHQLPAMIDYRYFVGRGQQRAAEAYTVFDRQIGQLCGTPDTAPWHERKTNTTTAEPVQVYDTPLLDLIEILPFIDTSSDTNARRP